jgi:hypothetical protein
MMFPPSGLAVCNHNTITDDTPDDMDRAEPPLDVAMLLPRNRRLGGLPHIRANLLLVFAEPVAVPPVRLLARLTALGIIYASARRRCSSVDGFVFGAPDPDYVIDAIVRSGVERTTAPRTWMRTHRSKSEFASSGR